MPKNDYHFTLDNRVQTFNDNLILNNNNNNNCPNQIIALIVKRIVYQNNKNNERTVCYDATNTMFL